MELEHLKLMLREYFSRLPDIAAVYLFGSFAKGRQGPNSDFDVAVLFTPEQKTKMQRFERRIDFESPLSVDFELRWYGFPGWKSYSIICCMNNLL